MISRKLFWVVAGMVVALPPGVGVSVAAHAKDGTGLQTAIAVDLAGTFASSSNSDANKVEAREAEIMFFAPIDHLFEGMFSLAAHQEGGAAFFEIHEAFLGSTTLIPRSKFRFGQYFPSIGRLQRFHRHDWPFTSAPKFYQEFFGEEGIMDTGLEFSYLSPSDLFLEVTGGLTNGWTFGHSHNAGARPLLPTHYLRLSTFMTGESYDGLMVGLNFLGRTSSEGEVRRHAGFDLTAKWKNARSLRHLIQTETWGRSLIRRGGEPENAVGSYLYAQTALGEQTSAGLRLDWYSLLTQKNAAGQALSSGTLAFVPVLGWKPSEFSVFKLSYAHELAYQTGSASTSNGKVELQGTFILGAHPAHDF